MNYIKHLTGFFDRIVLDRHLNPTHVSLYIALFQCWNVNRFRNPISITRDELMRISKICSKATYHKCMKELHDKGYIKYEPSFNPFKGSMVFVFNFSEDLKPPLKKDTSTPKISPASEQVVNKLQTSNETSTEQAVVPSINTINLTNNSNSANGSEPAHFKEIQNSVELEEKEKSSAKKEKEVNKPNQQQVMQFFQENNFPEMEAQKFFNYFSSNGWLVGGKTPMVDWHAAAQNWMLNCDKFNTIELITKPNHLNTTTNKNYAEPL